jgi:hypothetical protein
MKMLNANTFFKKRNHAELTVPKKREIIDYKKKFPKMSQRELISKCSFEYKTLITKSRMSDILKPDYERKFQIKQEQLKQTKIIDFFKKTTLTN